MFRAGGKSVATEAGNRKRIHTTWEGSQQPVYVSCLIALECILIPCRIGAFKGTCPGIVAINCICTNKSGRCPVYLLFVSIKSLLYL